MRPCHIKTEYNKNNRAASQLSNLYVYPSGGELTPLSGFTDFKPVRIDKPFFFIIRDKHNGVPLFVGKVMDPRQ